MERTLSAKPRINEKRFESFWSTGTGWGTFTQSLGAKNAFALKASEGSLVCRKLELAWNNAVKTVRLGDTPIDFKIEGEYIVLSSDAAVLPGTMLTVGG